MCCLFLRAKKNIFLILAYVIKCEKIVQIISLNHQRLNKKTILFHLVDPSYFFSHHKYPSSFFQKKFLYILHNYVNWKKQKFVIYREINGTNRSMALFIHQHLRIIIYTKWYLPLNLGAPRKNNTPTLP